MKGLVKYQNGDGFMELRDIPEPKAAAGQVKIEVAKTGICGSDLHIFHNDIDIPIRPPVITGHEFSGTIVEVGEGVEGWKVGDRVVSETAFAYCGVCLHCREGYYNLCNQRRTLGYWFDGAFAPYTVVPAARLHALPTELSFLEGALMEPLACVTHAVMELTHIQPRDWVLVSGPGAVGLATMQVAKAHNARVMVAGTDVDVERMKKATTLGADLVVNVQKENLLDIIKDVTGGVGVDVALECSGSARALESAILGVRKRGQLTQIGLYGKPITVDFEKICFKEIKVTGSLGSRWMSWENALLLTKTKKVKLEPLVSDIMPLSDWKKAFEMFERKEGLKLVLDPKK
ncbi:MAG: zinc-binding dehydrogenase [Treponemataceae bacterium]